MNFYIAKMAKRKYQLLHKEDCPFGRLSAKQRNKEAIDLEAENSIVAMVKATQIDPNVTYAPCLLRERTK